MMNHGRDTWIDEIGGIISKVPDANDFFFGFLTLDDATRAKWSRMTITGYLPTAAQISKGLSDHSEHVRAGWAARPDITPTADQIESALMDKSMFVLQNMVLRDDITLTADQIDYGLRHDEIHILVSYLKRDDVYPNPGQIERLFKKSDPVAQIYLTCIPEIRFTEAQLKHLSSIHEDTWSARLDWDKHAIMAQLIAEHTVLKAGVGFSSTQKISQGPRI